MGSKKYCIGDLRHFVALQQQTTVADGLGGRTVTWATEASFWARVKPVSAGQRMYGQRLEENISHVITARYNSSLDLSIGKRIRFDSRDFHIHGVINVDERNRVWEIMCEEGKAS